MKEIDIPILWSKKIKPENREEMILRNIRLKSMMFCEKLFVRFYKTRTDFTFMDIVEDPHKPHGYIRAIDFETSTAHVVIPDVPGWDKYVTEASVIHPILLSCREDEKYVIAFFELFEKWELNKENVYRTTKEDLL